MKRKTLRGLLAGGLTGAALLFFSNYLLRDNIQHGNINNGMSNIVQVNGEKPIKSIDNQQDTKRNIVNPVEVDDPVKFNDPNIPDLIVNMPVTGLWPMPYSSELTLEGVIGYSPEVNGFKEVQKGTDNQFLFTDLKSGHYDLSLIGTGQVQKHGVNVFDKDVTINITNLKGNTLQGFVEDSIEQRLDCVNIIYSMLGHELAETTTDNGGMFFLELPGTNIDEFKIGLAKEGYIPQTLNEKNKIIFNQPTSFKLLKAASLTAKVVDEGNNPVTRANVFLVNPHKEAKYPVFSQYARGVTGNDGTYTWDNVDPTKAVSIAAVKENMVQHEIPTIHKYPKCVDGLEVKVELKNWGYTYGVFIIDNESNKIQSIKLNLKNQFYDPNSPLCFDDKTVTEESTGNFSMIPPGIYRLNVDVEDYPIQTFKDIEIPGEDFRRVVLKKGINLDGFVGGTFYGPNGNLLKKRVSLIPGNDLSRQINVSTDQLGNFKVENILPEDYIVAASTLPYIGIDVQQGWDATNLTGNQMISMAMPSQLNSMITVKDAESNQPVPYFKFNFLEYTQLREDGRAIGRTVHGNFPAFNEDGNAQFYMGNHQLGGLLKVESPGFETERLEIQQGTPQNNYNVFLKKK